MTDRCESRGPLRTQGAEICGGTARVESKERAGPEKGVKVRVLGASEVKGRVWA